MGAITASPNKLPIRPGHNLKARLYGEGGGTGVCWNALLLQLKSCGKEIVLFFIDGETDLGAEWICCRAIHIITRDCWPSMLTSLGLCPKIEGGILEGVEGYRDATLASPAIPVQSPLKSPPAAV